MYQGIFDTDFDKYTEDAVVLFRKAGIDTAFENLEGFPKDWKTNTPAFVKFVRDHQCNSFLEYGGVPVLHERRDQEGPEDQGGARRDARTDAVGAVMGEAKTARTYNQDHAPRKYARGHRRVSVYVAWSYPGEANRDPTVLDNRFSTMTEVRRVFWPAYEEPQWSDPSRFQQGIAGSLELFFWAWVKFQRLVGEVTGHVVPMFQRVDQAGFALPLDERVLADTDTLFVFGLDHLVTEQVPRPEEIEAVREFLAREGTCLVIGPHHDVGRSDDRKERDIEYHHHGDALVPRQQRFGGYTRALMKGLGIPVENRWGLRPAVVAGQRSRR